MNAFAQYCPLQQLVRVKARGLSSGRGALGASLTKAHSIVLGFFDSLHFDAPAMSDRQFQASRTVYCHCGFGGFSEMKK